MPQLIFRGLSVEQVKTISTPLVQELADLCACGTDNFILAVENYTFVFDSQEIQTYPFIEVKWFDRGQEVQDKFANIITKQIQSMNIQDVEVAFIVYKESGYYLNGRHFAE